MFEMKELIGKKVLLPPFYKEYGRVGVILEIDQQEYEYYIVVKTSKEAKIGAFLSDCKLLSKLNQKEKEAIRRKLVLKEMFDKVRMFEG